MSASPATLPMTDRQFLGAPILADTHVHIHSCFDLGRFLDAAAANFTRAAGDLSIQGDVAGALLLTEVQGTSFFDALSHAPESLRGELGPWQAFSTPEPTAVLLEKPATMPLLLVAGRQIRTVEGLEVLALGCSSPIPDGRDIQDVLRQARQIGALPVIPWGFGKWTLARGRRIRTLIETTTPDAYCLGDVGGRWKGLRESRLLQEGRSRGFAILPGSDPLPFEREVTRPGSSGVALPCSLDVGKPVEELLRALREDAVEAQSYMELEGLGVFVRHQILMQLRKRGK